MAALGERRQVDVGRGDDADIDVVYLVAADALEGSSPAIGYEETGVAPRADTSAYSCANDLLADNRHHYV
jgi:hypothetical protein